MDTRNGTKILIVDDDPNVRHLCGRVLDREGFGVEIADSGTQGLQALTRGTFDLVLLDVYMPDRDGLDVLSTMRQTDLETPVIVFTGYGTMETAVAALKSGAQDFLLKPFEPGDLITSINRALEKDRLLRENLRLKTLLSILEISRELISEIDAEHLIRRVLQIVQRELDADQVAVLLLDERHQHLTISASLGLSDDSMADLSDRARQGLCWAAVQEKRPVLTSEWDTDTPAWNDETGRVACIPLTLTHRVLGVLYACRPPDSMPFRQDDVSLLSVLCEQAAVMLENTHLFERRRQEAEALRDTAAALNGTLDLEEVLDRILDNVGRVVPHDAANILLVEGSTARMVRHRGKVNQETDALWAKRFPVADMPGLSQMAASMLPVTVSNTQDLPDWVTFPNDPQVYSYVGAPICAQGKLVGFLNLNSYTPDTFQPAQAKRLQAFADQAAIAIENARLHERLQGYVEQLETRVMDRTRDLAALYEVTKIASESLDLKSTLERTLDQVMAALGGSFGAVHVLDEAGKELRLITQRSTAPKIVDPVSRLLAQDALTGWVLEHNEAVVVPDLLADARLPPGLDSAGFRAYAGVPMRIERRAIGVLCVLSETEHEYNVEDVALLASIADHTATAVENDRLRQHAERAAILEERERLARDLHDSVSQSLYSLTLFAEAGCELVQAGETAEAAHYLRRVSAVAQVALKEMRLMLHDLQPPLLEKEGLVGALRRRLEAVEGRARVETRFLADELIDLPAPVQEGLYHIACEALNNALKHAASTFVQVHIRIQGQGVELEIADDGRGFDPDKVGGSGGMGLNSMRERAEKLGGVLTIQSTPGKGTTVTVRIAEVWTNGNHQNSDRR